MTIVTLDTLWLNPAADLADFQSYPFMSAKASSPQQNVQLQQFAQGRVRAISTPGNLGQLAPTLGACTQEQTGWLEANAGQLVCVRDDKGRKFYAIYTAPQVAEHQYNTDADVSLTLDEVTVSEAV